METFLQVREDILKRQKECFEELINVENTRERRLEDAEVENQDAHKQRGGEEGHEKDEKG